MIKLNIQRFSSTNKTTHYDLSQYVASDLPTYLVDYNSDMSKIDTAINSAQTTADTASTAATNAQTAAEGAQTTASTAVTNAATAQTTADTANANVGTLANLETAVKTSVVAAINEVVGNVGNKANLETTTKTDLVSALNELDETKEYAPVVLWSNSNTNQSYAAGTVTLSDNIANYEYFEVIAYVQNAPLGSGRCISSGVVPTLSCRVFTVQANTMRWRDFDPNGTNQVDIAAAGGGDNSTCIPYEILGYKRNPSA